MTQAEQLFLRRLRRRSRKQLQTVVQDIVDVLYREDGELNPDKEWDESTIESVAQCLIDRRLCP